MVRIVRAEDEARPANITRESTRRPHMLPGLIDAHGHVMGARLQRAAARPVRHALARRGAAAAARPMPPPIPTRAGSSAAAGTRSCGPASASRPPPTSTRWSATARSGSSGRRPCRGRQQRGDEGRRDHRGNQGAGRRADRERPVRRRGDGPGRRKDPAAAREQDAGRSPRRRRSCSATASPRSPTWAPRRGLGRYGRAGEAGRLNVRIIAYAGGIPQCSRSAAPSRHWLYGDRLRMGGVKLYADGALGSRGAWLKQPYADEPDTRGLQFLTRCGAARARPMQAAARGFQVAIHAIGDAANAQVIGDLRAAWRRPIRATAAGGSSMPRSSIRPTSRASAKPGSSPRCSRPTRPATG